MDKRKVNSVAAIFSIHTRPKSRLCVFLCRMVAIPIVRHALNNNTTKLKAYFFNDYHNDDRVYTYRPLILRETFNFEMMMFVHLKAQIGLKPMPYLNFNWMQTLHSYHTRTTCS